MCTSVFSGSSTWGGWGRVRGLGLVLSRAVVGRTCYQYAVARSAKQLVKLEASGQGVPSQGSGELLRPRWPGSDGLGLPV